MTELQVLTFVSLPIIAGATKESGLLRDYLEAVTDHLGDHAQLTVPVMNAAGLSAADWYRRMLAG